MICPKCASENTTGFVDVKDNSHGYHCEDCHQDFGVIDEKKLALYQKNFISLYFRKEEKRGKTFEVRINRNDAEQYSLELTLTENKVRTTSEPIDFTSYFQDFFVLLFGKMYVLDWNDREEGILLPEGNESYELDITFRMGLIPPIHKTGTNKFPPYEKALENLFSSLFVEMEPGK